jgi:hypothetical protein
MMRFAPLLALEIAHDYHGPGPAPLDFIPDVATERLAARPDLRLRLSRGRAEVFAAEDRDALAALAGGEGLRFTFRIYPADPRLAAVTAAVSAAVPPARAAEAIAIVEIDGPGTVRAIGEDDLRPLEPGVVVTARDALVRPLAIVRVRVDPAARDVRHALRFEAAERFWTYHVIGGAPGARFQVRDRDGAVAFRALGARVMANGASAQSFRSDVPIAASARPARRFQLLAEGPYGPRSVVETLPAPRPGPGGIDRDEGAARAVSEIYVNL